MRVVPVHTVHAQCITECIAIAEGGGTRKEGAEGWRVAYSSSSSHIMPSRSRWRFPSVPPYWNVVCTMKGERCITWAIRVTWMDNSSEVGDLGRTPERRRSLSSASHVARALLSGAEGSSAQAGELLEWRVAVRAAGSQGERFQTMLALRNRHRCAVRSHEQPAPRRRKDLSGLCVLH